MPSHHPIMLCQPDQQKSCGACCGQFNWTDHSRAGLTEIIKLQTRLFFELERHDDFTEYQSRRNAAITNKKLFETIYNCEFLGFIDSNHRRVGCMLHPAVTGNQALRNNCFYGSKICNEHFCPSFGCLTTVEQRAVVESLDDWYLYGLVITDIDLVKEFFRHVENALGEGIKEKRLGNPKIRGLFREYFSLKETWPYKASKNRLGKYYFSKAEYAIARIEYEKKWGLPVSRYDKILVSLESDFKGPEQLKQAEEILDSIIRRFIEFYAAL